MTEHIRQARWLAGLTQGELAQRAGLCERYIALLERAAVLNPSFCVLFMIAKATGVSVEDLVSVNRKRVDLDALIMKQPPKRWHERQRWAQMVDELLCDNIPENRPKCRKGHPVPVSRKKLTRKASRLQVRQFVHSQLKRKQLSEGSNAAVR